MSTTASQAALAPTADPDASNNANDLPREIYVDADTESVSSCAASNIGSDDLSMFHSTNFQAINDARNELMKSLETLVQNMVSVHQSQLSARPSTTNNLPKRYTDIFASCTTASNFELEWAKNVIDNKLKENNRDIEIIDVMESKGDREGYVVAKNEHKRYKLSPNENQKNDSLYREQKQIIN